jgi:hypothetical protein
MFVQNIAQKKIMSLAVVHGSKFCVYLKQTLSVGLALLKKNGAIKL